MYVCISYLENLSFSLLKQVSIIFHSRVFYVNYVLDETVNGQSRYESDDFGFVSYIDQIPAARTKMRKSINFNLNQSFDDPNDLCWGRFVAQFAMAQRFLFYKNFSSGSAKLGIKYPYFVWFLFCGHAVVPQRQLRERVAAEFERFHAGLFVWTLNTANL